CRSAEAAEQGHAVVERRGVELAGLVDAGGDGGEVVEDVAGAVVLAALLGVGVVEEDVAAGVEDGLDGPEVLERALDGVVAVDQGEIDAARGRGTGVGAEEPRAPGRGGGVEGGAERVAGAQEFGGAVAGVEDDEIGEAGLLEIAADDGDAAGGEFDVAPGAG